MTPETPSQPNSAVVSLTRPAPAPWLAHWTLDPAVVFLNHGSFGACPRLVLAAQQQWRDRLERQPLQFFARDLEALLDNARSALADFVGADPRDLAMIPNATTGVNTVLRSLTFGPDDELLTTNQEYNACRNALNFVAARSGATVVVAELPWPCPSAPAIIDAVLSKVTARTRLVLLDHVVSQTGLILPIPALVAALTARGIDTLIDGAHAPGMVPLALRSLGATYYTGNCHKWLCAPKGCAFLYAQRDRQSQIRPLTISHGANAPRRDRSRFWLEFDWMGTDDPTAHLALPTAIAVLGDLLPGGWPALMAHNRDLARTARTQLSQQLGLPLPCPDDLVGAMATLPLPPGDPLALQAALWDTYQIEIPIIPFPQADSRLVRLSAQIYNTPAQYDYLGHALQTLL